MISSCRDWPGGGDHAYPCSGEAWPGRRGRGRSQAAPPHPSLTRRSSAKELSTCVNDISLKFSQYSEKALTCDLGTTMTNKLEMNAKWKNQNAPKMINTFHEPMMPVCKDPFKFISCITL